MSEWKNDIKCKYIMFPMNDSARKRLTDGLPFLVLWCGLILVRFFDTLHWLCDYRVIVPVPMKQMWRILLKSSSLHKNGRLFADDIFRCIIVNEKFCSLVKMSLKFVPKGAIDNNPALVQKMACRRISDKPLSEPMLTRFTDAYMRH